MSEEEKETIKYIESGIDTYIENTKVTKIVISEEQAKILLNLIKKLEKKLEQEKEKNKELFLNYEKRVNELEFELAKRLQELSEESEEK